MTGKAAARAAEMLAEWSAARLADPDPLARLSWAYVAGERLDVVRLLAIAEARAMGYSWAAIARELGVSRQTVVKRYGHLIGEPSRRLDRRRASKET